MKQHVEYLLVILVTTLLFGCTPKPRSIRLPPVTEGWHKLSAIKTAYVVQDTDTLYSIAWAFGVDYRYLADLNMLKAPYALHRGQRLHIAPRSKGIKYQTKPVREFEYNARKVSQPMFGWVWPTLGKVASIFSNKLGGNKGIDIAGGYGQPILACNHGIVVYSGTGISSYGKLIILKHNDDYLSAYAYNQQMLVAEGQKIIAGQKIATMGRDNDGKAALHFEIRHFGKPVNPLTYLPKKL